MSKHGYSNVQEFTRHGRVYRYHRPTKTRLPGDVGSPEFDEAYLRALALNTKEKPPRFIYFVRGLVTGHVKIGMSLNPRSRFQKIATDCSEPVEMMRTFWSEKPSAVESDLRRRFSSAQSHGEWYRPSAALMDYIENALRQPTQSAAVKP